MDELCGLYASPLVSGTRAAAYFGPIGVIEFLPKPIEFADDQLDRILDALQRKAYSLGANAVVGLEVTIDPFAVHKEKGEGITVNAVGTAARLESLF
jgi:hypothetical protein